jgi:hypothetical protein
VTGDLVRVLTVDDEPDDRAMVRHEIEALYPHGEVVEAGSPKSLTRPSKVRRWILL